jgi:hypothetical protein
MRVRLIWICGLVAACSSGAVTVPSEPVITEVPQAGVASSAGADSFTSTIESALAEPIPAVPGAPAVPASELVAAQGSASGTGAALDDDRINLMQWTLAQQRVDAAIAEQDLAEARSKLVVVQPGSVPSRPGGANVALFAVQTTNAVGERAYDRSIGARVASAGSCGRYRDADAAQRAFLDAGGPQQDRLGLDPDGDGFACRWDPAPYRALR